MSGKYTRHHKNLKAAKHGLRLDISKLDGRCVIAKAHKELMTALRDYVGETIIITELLIHRIAYKAIKLSLYEANKIDDMKAEDSPLYIPLSNSLRLDLIELQKMVGTNQRPPDLNQYINTKYGSKDKKK